MMFLKPFTIYHDTLLEFFYHGYKNLPLEFEIRSTAHNKNGGMADSRSPKGAAFSFL